VYVGNVSARIRDKLWGRVVSNLKTGRAVLVYSSNNEQGLSYKVHNSYWEPVDFEGLSLVLRPSSYQSDQGNIKEGFSNAKKVLFAEKKSKQKAVNSFSLSNFIVIDVETTGIDISADHIIEIAAIKVINDQIVDTMSSLINQNITVPIEIQKLTGITTDDLAIYGRPIHVALKKLSAFVEQLPVVGHNVLFDYRFLRKSFQNIGVSPINSKMVDTLRLAKKYIRNANDYSLSSVAGLFGITVGNVHRALDDCMTTLRIYEALKNEFM